MKHNARPRLGETVRPPLRLVDLCLPVLCLHAPACTCECTHASLVHLVLVRGGSSVRKPQSAVQQRALLFRKDARMSLSHKA